MISSQQIRAGRALLRWTAQDLAEHSKVGVSTIRRIELTNGIPASNANTLLAIKRALESGGVELVGDPEKSPGVRLKGVTD